MNDNTLFEADETLTVGQLHRRLNEAVRRSFSREIWLQGQIRNLSRSGRGHVYFDLVDPVAAGAQPKASLAVTLFDSNRQIVNRIITRTGNNVRIDDGVEVRIKGSVELYVPRGQLQLNMTSIDPEFTLGRLGADRDQLLRDLKAEDLIDANSRLMFPVVPLRVALITSGGSAAHADFHKQIIESGYAFEISTLSTRVQGEYAPEEIAEMIMHGDDLDVDVIAIVRGGGARTDLAAFDTAPVARAIAGCQKPVLCGIGHEIDSSVADVVAHLSFKTPTACAQHLVERIVAFDFELSTRHQQLQQLAAYQPAAHTTRLGDRARVLGERVASTLSGASATNAAATHQLERRVVRAITRSEQRLTASQSALGSLATNAITTAEHRCQRSQDRLRAQPTRLLRTETQALDLFDARLSAVDPVQALRRGYSITTTAGGQLVRHTSDVDIGTELTTRLAEGTLTSTVLATGPAPSTAPQDTT